MFQLNGQLKGQVFRGGESVSFPAGFLRFFRYIRTAGKEVLRGADQKADKKADRKADRSRTKRKETGADREASKDRKRGPDEVG